MKVTYKVEDNRPTGGQSCGKIPTTIIGEIEDLGIEMKCSYHKSQYKNRELIEEAFKYIVEKLKLPKD